MTISVFENSNYEGSPIELFTFTHGLETFNYTSSDSDKTVGGVVYKAIPIERGGISDTQELAKSDLTIKIDINCNLADLYLTLFPNEPVIVHFKEYHEKDISQEISFKWSGRISNVTFSELTATIKCESLFTGMRRVMLRRRYQINCPHELYGSQCKLSLAEAALTASISSHNGCIITVAGISTPPDMSLAGGMLDYPQEGSNKRRSIVSNVGLQIVTDIPYRNLIVGKTITVYPGCNRTFANCIAKGNSDNYGGQPFFGVSNPFKTTLF